MSHGDENWTWNRIRDRISVELSPEVAVALRASNQFYMWEQQFPRPHVKQHGIGHRHNVRANCLIVKRKTTARTYFHTVSQKHNSIWWPFQTARDSVSSDTPQSLFAVSITIYYFSKIILHIFPKLTTFSGVQREKSNESNVHRMCFCVFVLWVIVNVAGRLPLDNV